jgi:thiol-disulfide isomerase/thioredoxin
MPLFAVPVAVSALVAPAAPAPQDDPRAVAVLRRAEARLRSLRSVEGEWEHTARWNGADGKPTRVKRETVALRLARPNLWRVETHLVSVAPKRLPTDGDWADVSDGKTATRLLPDHQYTTGKPSAARALENFLPLKGFFPPASGPATLCANRRRLGDRVTLAYLGRATWAGVLCEGVRVHFRPVGEDAKYRLEKTHDIYVGADGLIHRWVETPPAGDTVYETNEWTARRLVADVPPPPGTFALTLPADARPYAPPANRVLLPAGTPAPDFAVTTADGKTVSLSDYRGKVVVLDFWATWCGPCFASFPHTADVAKRTAELGAVFLAIDSDDARPLFDTWVTGHPQFAPVVFATADKAAPDAPLRAYHVWGLPTQYVIDPQGRVSATFVSYDGPTDVLEKAIRKAATAKP